MQPSDEAYEIIWQSYMSEVCKASEYLEAIRYDCQLVGYFTTGKSV